MGTFCHMHMPMYVCAQTCTHIQLQMRKITFKITVSDLSFCVLGICNGWGWRGSPLTPGFVFPSFYFWEVMMRQLFGWVPRLGTCSPVLETMCMVAENEGWISVSWENFEKGQRVFSREEYFQWSLKGADSGTFVGSCSPWWLPWPEDGALAAVHGASCASLWTFHAAVCLMGVETARLQLLPIPHLLSFPCQKIFPTYD